MLSGVYLAKKKDGTVYFRSNITYRNKHISLGSFPTEEKAHEAYCVAQRILEGKYLLEELLEAYTPEKLQEEYTPEKMDVCSPEVLQETYIQKEREEYTPEKQQETCTPEKLTGFRNVLGFDKALTLLNFRDNGLYIATPIYMRQNYFSYYLSASEELKFDIDDLFYYSRHRIMRRQGHLYVNDYGMQVTLMSRYGLRNYSVCNRDYYFANGDETDLRYSNIVVINRYYGVTSFEKKGKSHYRVKIHINGNYTVGTYSTEEKAAVAYNKAVDLAKKAGINRNFPENYVDTLTAKEYADLYLRLKISQKYLDYLRTFPDFSI